MIALIKWGIRNDPLAPLCAAALPVFVLALALILKGLFG